MGWLKSFFGPGNDRLMPDMSALAVDMHSHLIPGLDDGVKTLQESLDLIRKYAEMGYRKLITTPHISEKFPNQPEEIRNRLEALNRALQEEMIPVSVEAAAEYMLEDRFEQIMYKNALMTFGDHNILLECSYYFPYPALSNILYELQSEGYNVILAHVERYSYWHHKLEEYEKLKNRDVRFQVNFSSLSGPYAFGMRKMARKLIELGWVDYAGSDVHSDRYFEWFRRGILDKHGQMLLNSGKLKNRELL